MSAVRGLAPMAGPALTALLRLCVRVELATLGHSAHPASMNAPPHLAPMAGAAQTVLLRLFVRAGLATRGFCVLLM